ncbi:MULTISPECIES: NAD(P)H-binding protein [Pseudomonas]|uniref:NAD(P)H-binding protein n=1 Tax=Pseudomonas donghuensis TaxID=1163398 RepID=A0AAP0XF39_9PSED|nr:MULTISPECIES: NAD(P)H-binding protein [Pseudomonas]MBS7598663.1 NAD(P)H-binding protein [Pseudomonas sp. RC2C2]MDF9890970.1 putative NADH-flavin reductase [Pseudomonas vranovensis]KDN99910.1 NAD(P)H-binding protein [Pseudomonas donghuensis]MBF4210493.1 NADH-flavin reductase [Pseudomonas donghuensis]MCP6690371.1 NAD(P)H-binding protein [Pseudomonas donghuensis]
MKNAETPAFKLVLLGGLSSLGSALMAELLKRQHEVIAVVDNLNSLAPRPGLHFKTGGLDNPDQAEQSVAGGSAVVCLLPALAPDDFAAQLRMSQALIAGMTRTTIRRLLLVGDFSVLDQGEGHSEQQRACADQIVDLLQRSPLHWTLINSPQQVAGLGIEHFHQTHGTLEPGLAEPLQRLARVAAAMVDALELKLHHGEHVNFVF